MTSNRLQGQINFCLQHGFSMVPLRSGTKIPSVSGWQNKALYTREAVEPYLATGKENLGINTGLSGILIIDIDVKQNSDGSWKRGEASIQGLERDLGALPETLTVATTSCGIDGKPGRHLYFKIPADLVGRVDRCQGPEWADLDVLSGPFQAVAPGSELVNAEGKVIGQYAVCKGLPIAALPDAWVKALKIKGSADKASEKKLIVNNKIVDPARNSASSKREWTLPSLTVETAPGTIRAYKRDLDCFKPGEDLNRRGHILPLLLRHGWTVDSLTAQGLYLTRPGKATGVSGGLAIVNQQEYFFVFTTGAEFEAAKGYDVLSVLAILDFKGDYSSAASAAYKAGFGYDSRRLTKSALERAREIAQRERTTTAAVLRRKPTK